MGKPAPTVRQVAHRAREHVHARRKRFDDVDPELLLDVVFGVLWYRLLLEHAPLDDAAAGDLATLVVRAAAPERSD